MRLGATVATRGALAALEEADQTAEEFFLRHAHGDWGEVSTEDWGRNDASVSEGSGAMSVYTLKTGIKIRVITDADQSATTVLLPEEY